MKRFTTRCLERLKRMYTGCRTFANACVRMPAALLFGLGACSDEPGVREDASSLLSDSAATESLAGGSYERHLAFFAVQDGSPLGVVWSFSASTGSDAVARRAHVWLALDGQWDAFFGARWNTPVTRTPWRVVPHGGIRLIVGERDALTALIYRKDGREVETWPGETLAGWTSRPGELVQVRRALTTLAGGRAEGVLADISFARQTSEAPPGNWAFLTSEGTNIFLRESFDTPSDSIYQGWAVLGVRNFDWRDVSVTVTRSAAYEPARRDVPVAWSFRSLEGGLTGRIQAMSNHMEADDGPGPQLPLIAVSALEGSVEVEGAPYRVRGFFYHRSP